MTITASTLEPDGRVCPGAEVDVLQRWRAGQACWIDFTDARSEELAAWLSSAGVAADVVEQLAVEQDHLRILPQPDVVVMSLPVHAAADGSSPAHFRFACVERLLVTWHRGAGTGSWLDHPLLRRGRLPDPSAAGVICALAVIHASRIRRDVIALRHEEEHLADRMQADPWSVPFEEVLALKRRVLALGGVVDEQLAVLEVLKVSRHPLLPLSRIADVFQAAVDVTRSTERDLDRLDRRLGELQQRHQSAEQDRTNRRLGTLTVLSAIFMPLTLIAGIYGMNFEYMPELHLRYGYFLALGAMALVAGGLGWYFRARWWKK